MTTPEASTLAALLRLQAEERADRTAYRYLAAGELETRALTFAELELDARAVAARLREHAAPGDRALILADDAIEFIRAFMGCQLAGVIAVPASPPFPSQRGRRVETLRAIAADCGARIVLSDARSELHDRVARVAPDLGALCWIATDEIGADAAADFADHIVRPADVAFLQYTSGSTSTPKGVVVTHEMVLCNEAYIRRALDWTVADTMVSWLPLFHDMGLIGGVLPTLYCGTQTVLMPPSVFARRPVQWLRAITRFRGTITAAPDSAYRLCVEKIGAEERAELDLSSWRVAVSGAEPVLSATLDAFDAAFGPCGFKRSTWLPTYGLAESTLMTTSTPAGAGPRTLRRDKLMVACGAPMMHRRVEIVDPLSCRRVQPGAVGEIWIGGPDVARAYWGREQESEATFGATIAGSGEGPFLRSGDLGLLDGGQLYVTGRLKDLIIVAGRNHYPQDIEATAVSVHSALVDGGCVAFSNERDGIESAVVVAELCAPRSRLGVDLDELAARIRAVVASEHDIALADVVLVDRKSVPKTSSGKVQRAACRASYERGELRPAQPYSLQGEVLAQPTAAERRETLRRLLVEQIESVLHAPPGTVDTAVSFRDLGLDSLRTAELRDRLEAALGERMSAATFFAHPTTDQLVERLLGQIAGAEPGDAAAEPGAGDLAAVGADGSGAER